jgi:3-carboxy-cis,cis-muconate cycloisomerase
LAPHKEKRVSARLIDGLATTGALANLFSDESVLQAALAFEVALARAEAGLGIIPQAAADAIERAARTSDFDVAKLAHDALRAGTVSIPLVKALTAHVRVTDSAASCFVHWGATSQDVADTALMLLIKQAQPIISADLTRLEESLRRLSDEHLHTVLLDRTLLQAAPPVTFGLKAAGWHGAIRRSRARFESALSEALVVQFGGASGTWAALGRQGLAVGRGIARELELGFPDASWHTHRDRPAAMIVACGVLTGCLGKMARDISLLMQSEVNEVAEPGGEGRGGSSTMPNKRNPIACAVTLAAAHRVPGLVATFLSSMVQEHERAVGDWQAEWPTIAAVIQATGLAAASMAEAAEGLDVNKARMRANIVSTRGTIFAEKAMILLAGRLARAVAHRVLEEATRRSNAEGRRLSEVLADLPEVRHALDSETLANLDAPGDYLGVADALQANLLSDPKLPGSGGGKE